MVPERARRQPNCKAGRAGAMIYTNIASFIENH
jgi:hypothetical protein